MKKIFTCSDCGARFTDPTVLRWTENHGDGMLEQWAEYHCPICGSAEVDEDWEDEDAGEDSV